MNGVIIDLTNHFVRHSVGQKNVTNTLRCSHGSVLTTTRFGEVGNSVAVLSYSKFI